MFTCGDGDTSHVNPKDEKGSDLAQVITPTLINAFLVNVKLEL